MNKKKEPSLLAVAKGIAALIMVGFMFIVAVSIASAAIGVGFRMFHFVTQL